MPAARLLTSGARDFHAYTARDFSDSHRMWLLVLRETTADA
jgi:hypothetical protein